MVFIVFLLEGRMWYWSAGKDLKTNAARYPCEVK